MYCPVCFDPTLQLKPRGVVEVMVDQKQMDAGRFLFNADLKPADIEKALKVKLEEFMCWYSNFKNKRPIEKIVIVTNNVFCTNGCNIPLDTRYNIIGDVISGEKVKNMVEEMAKKYKLELSANLSL